MSKESEKEAEILRLTDRIRSLTEALERGYFVLFGEGDPDFPEGVKLAFPSKWKTTLRTCIKTLKERRKALLA